MVGFQEMVQSICRNAAPLAKLMDYHEEDAASMAKELTMWQAETRAHRAKLVEESKETARLIAPMEDHLKQLSDEAAAMVSITRERGGS
jgi:hypothetical protein